MKRVAVIVQRYGLDVNGGAETYARETAELLSKKYQVEVLTTCAVDYTTWANHYPAGEDKVNGIPVRRFPVSKPRSNRRFTECNNELFGSGQIDNPELENQWVDLQGPLCPKLIQYLDQNQDHYDAFVFITYLYYLTVRGMPVIGKKALLVPTAHDEPYIHLPIYRDVFLKPGAIAYLTVEERNFVLGLFGNTHIPEEVVGMGIATPENVFPEQFMLKNNLQDYIIYVGRVDPSKGCEEMMRFFIQYKESHPGPLKLVLLGKAVMPIPKHPDILYLGFVDEQVKYDAIAGARMLLLPSMYESLSISVLEAMNLSVPIVVNGRCEVLKGHCARSNGGLYYNSYHEFEAVLQYLFSHPDVYAALKANALSYVQQNYTHAVVEEKYDRLLEHIFALKQDAST